MSWSLWITSQGMWWHSSPRIRKQKPSCIFSMSDSSQCLVHQWNCSVTVAQLHCHCLLKSSAQHLAFRSAGWLHTMYNAMDRWKDSTRHCSEWLESWLQTRRLNGNNTSQNFCRPTTVPRSAVTGYSPHYLMFGRWPCLPVDFFFPMIGANTSHCHCVPLMWKRCKSTSKKLMLKPSTSPTVKQDRQKCNYDKSMSTVQLMPGDVVLKKADAFQGKRKVKDHWSEVRVWGNMPRSQMVCPHMRSRTWVVMWRSPTIIDSSCWPPHKVKPHPYVKAKMPTSAHVSPGLP